MSFSKKSFSSARFSEAEWNFIEPKDVMSNFEAYSMQREINNLNQLETIKTLQSIVRRIIQSWFQLYTDMDDMLKKSEKQNNHVLIARTTGVISGILGVAAVTLAPITAGGSLFAGGIIASVAGGVTTVASSITDNVLRKKYEKLQHKYTQEYFEIKKQFNKVLKSNPKVWNDFQEFMGNERANEHTSENLKCWLRKRSNYEDDFVSVLHLKPGDHIMRKLINNGPFIYHHGVFLGNEQVVDFGTDSFNKENAKVRFITLKHFLEDKETSLKRRNYLGHDVTLKKTLELASELYKNHSEYHFFQNNCEHFATRIKVDIPSSSQVKNAKKETLTAAKVIPVASKVATDTALYKPAVGLFDELLISAAHYSPIARQFLTNSVPVVSKLRLVMLPVSVLMTAADIFFLNKDFKKVNLSKEENQELLSLLKKEYIYLKKLNNSLILLQQNVMENDYF